MLGWQLLRQLRTSSRIWSWSASTWVIAADQPANRTGVAHARRSSASTRAVRGATRGRSLAATGGIGKRLAINATTNNSVPRTSHPRCPFHHTLASYLPSVKDSDERPAATGLRGLRSPSSVQQSRVPRDPRLAASPVVTVRRAHPALSLALAPVGHLAHHRKRVLGLLVIPVVPLARAFIGRRKAPGPGDLHLSRG